MVDGILCSIWTRPAGWWQGHGCADIIARVRDAKAGMGAGQRRELQCRAAAASAASRRLVADRRTGSIGVMMAHSNYGAALEKQGVEITL